MGYNIIFIPKIKYLDNSICAHPDLSVFKLDENLFISSDVDHLFTLLKKYNTFKIMRKLSSNNTKLKYPHDAQFNAAVVGKYLLANKNSFDKDILKFVSNNGYVHINVNQGYTKCCICVVNDNSIITEDEGIAAVCKSYGIDVLLLKTHAVKLDGYNYGFIGGASGKLDNNTLVFAGCIEKHPEYTLIKDFCETRRVNLISLSDEPIYDVGSIMII